MLRARDALRGLLRTSDIFRREARASRDVVQNLNKDRYSVVLKQVHTRQLSQTQGHGCMHIFT